MRTLPTAGTRRAYGAVGLALLASLVGAGVASYRGAFIDTVPVTVEADRSGLIMQAGSPVLIRGVAIGQVAAVRPSATGGATLELKLDPGELVRIPRDPAVSIDATTVFGPKAVAIAVPVARPADHLQAGAVLHTRMVSTEVNDVFANLNSLLRSVDVGKLNAALGGVAQVLDGRGGELGHYVDRVDSYLAVLNTTLPTIRADLASVADVSETYAASADDLVRVLQGTTVTARTIVDLQATLDGVLVGLASSADRGRGFLRQAGPPLITALAALRPTARLLAEYSPELTCTLKGLNRARYIIGLALGNQMPALVASASVLPGQQAYQPGRDLPQVVTGLGPDCYQLPYVQASQIPLPRYNFADGSQHVYAGHTDDLTPADPPVTLYDSIFGTGR
jgi:phospholipid/cholesterol/gamma-HCH transport system substrate-binding protein